MSSQVSVTQLLVQARDGDLKARDELLRITLAELRQLARSYLADERPDHTLQPSALVNEVCLRLLEGETLPGKNRAQFFAYVARAMHHVLVDHARARQAWKRGGGLQRVPFEEGMALKLGGEPNLDLLALDEALERLGAIDVRKVQVVELRYFAGLSVDETAAAIGVSPATVDRDWGVAKLWLLREIRKGDSHVE